MSPVSSIYDHLTFNIHQQPTTMNQIHLPNSKSNYENLHLLIKQKSLPIDEHQAQIKRRYTITNISIPESIRHPSMNNYTYDIKKSSTTQNISTHQQTNPRYYRIPSSASNMDFRPLITNGRRKFSAIPSSSSMIIIKKKSPSPMKYISYNQKPLIRSIPVNLINNHTAIAVSPMIPSSLSYSSSSYSSSSPSTSASSTNVGTIFLPIQVTKSQKNIINNNNNTIKYSSSNTIILNEGQQGYRCIDPPNSFVYYHPKNRIQLVDDDDLDQSTRIPSASSIGGEGYNYKSTIMMDSNVLRLIRRYDPGGSSTIGIIPRRSLESTRGLWHSASSKTDTPQPSDSSPFLSRRSLTTTYEDEIPLKQSPTSRLQRQQAIHESESPPSIPPPPPLRPILKYNTSSRSRSEFIVQPHQTEPLTIHIDPFIPPLPNESPATYQPLITTGTKRVCSALSKSEWDLRLQQEQLPIRPPSPSPLVINQQQEKESYQPTLRRSKSSITINNTNDQDDHIDDVDEISAPILPSGSCVEKLKQLFVTKSSLDLTNPSRNKKQQQQNDSNLHRHINPNNPIDHTIKPTPIEIQPHIITKPTTIIQDVTPIFKKPIYRSQKTIDRSMNHDELVFCPESVNRSNNSIQMPSSELSFDAYRFRRLNNQDSGPTRPRNIAKVEPYSMNTNTIRPLYQSSQPITEPTVVPSLKARSHLNSMGNTPINPSTSSSAGSLRHSDFLISNSAYSKPYPHPHPQPTSASSSYPIPPILLSESLSHGSLHQLPAANIPSYNGHATGLPSLKNNSQDKYHSQSSMQMHSPSLTNHSIPTNSYHYRPLQNIERQQIDMPIRSAMIEEQQQDNQQSRRRFHRRKQMKRSKSADLYQEPSSFMSPTTNQQDLNKSYRPQRSISREHLEGGEHISSSSSSSSLTVDIERVNRAALLRYKSLDSITINNRKSNPTSNRRMISKPAEFDFDSDDSVCGIPKPRKLCTSSKNVAKSERTLLDSPKDHQENIQPISIHDNIGSTGTSTGITNAVRKNETSHDQEASMVVEVISSTTKIIPEKKEEEPISLSESQFYARTSNTPWYPIKSETKTQELFIHEPIKINTSLPIRPLSNSIINNPFERLRPMEIQSRTEETSLQIFDQPNDRLPEIPSKILIPDQFDDNNDSSTSTTTNRSIHLPVEKQRGLSEIIRKRNSKCKVEDYKRSIQKSTTVDEEPIIQTIPTSKNDHELIVSTILPSVDLTPKYFDVPINVQNTNDKRAQLSIERLNLLLSKDEQQEIDDKLSVADKRNLFETISKDTQIGGTLPRSKSFKNEESPLITKKYANGNQRSQTDSIIKIEENETYDDDISKLSFKEKMTLFNKNKTIGLAPTSSLKNNRNRLTQPITAEEVQAAANLTPPSSTKQLSDGPDESEIIIPVSKRLEQFKAIVEIEKVPNIEQKSRKTPTLKYNTKKINTDLQQRAKTVDIVRLKTDSAVKAKDTDKTNGSIPVKSNQNVISVVKSDRVSVLKPDDRLDEFFADTSKGMTNETTVQLNTDDLNRLAENTTRLQSQVQRVRPPRRQQQGAKNPLRQIQATITTLNEYTEVHTDLSEQELRRLKRAQIAENAGVAQEALAALATTENFAEINLRKVDQLPVVKFAYEPYKDLMLILIKGRHSCSLRLVNPIYESLNEGDCYLLLTPLKVFAWFGRYANSSEKSKTIELIDYLKQHRDFGLRNEVKYFLLDQGKDDTENDLHAEFRDILQGSIDNYKSMDDVTDDDFYEMNITELNRVYQVENDLLMPLNQFCFHSLSVKILDPNEVFVFDFGSELYVWNGKFADKIKRNMGLQLAQQLWNDAYDYSECVINPFDPLDDNNDQGNQIGLNRPTWCIFGKQNQNVETLLFKGKFFDWPNDHQELKSSTDINKLPATQRPLSIVETLKPADVDKMLVKQDNPVNLILDQINFGRGKQWYDPFEKRGHQIQTLSINVWHVNDNDRHELPKSSYGQFYSDDVYIIRWKYKLNPIGIERKTDITRDRVIYWIWQGINANLNEKGISAIMSVFLNEEKGVHVHVIQEHEEATFLQLFDGTLTIHIGQREIDVETHWWELNVNSAHLRSRTSFLLVNNVENLMLLWHGCGTTDEQQAYAKNSVMKLRERCPEEFHFDGESDDIEFFEMQEGDEIELFWEGINEKQHQRKYYSLLNLRSNAILSSTMRIFHLSSLHGPFVAQEFIYSLRSSDHISAFPFTQSDLYELHQPALCLVDTDSELYIWQGWNDQSDDELGLQLSNANLLVRGPKDIRFTTERRCAFRTAIDYSLAKTGSSTIDSPCSIVYAGLEPIDFTNLFPKWNVNIKARQQNQLDGKKINQKDSVIDLLNQLCREQYTIEELRARPLPEGVDPSKIESYLSESDFQKEFHMTKDEFYALPYWKQTNIKKPLGFF